MKGVLGVLWATHCCHRLVVSLLGSDSRLLEVAVSLRHNLIRVIAHHPRRQILLLVGTYLELRPISNEYSPV